MNSTFESIANTLIVALAVCFLAFNMRSCLVELDKNKIEQLKIPHKRSFGTNTTLEVTGAKDD